MSGPALKFIPPRVPLIDLKTGIISREWYLFLQGIFIRTGAEPGDNSTDINNDLVALTAVVAALNTAFSTQRQPVDYARKIGELEMRIAQMERRQLPDNFRVMLDEIRAFVFGA